MPSSVVTGQQMRLARPVASRRSSPARPDRIVTQRFAAAELTGANSGIYILVATAPLEFVDAELIYTTAGTNTARLKKILSASASAPGAAADTNNIDVSTAFDLTLAANVRQRATAVALATSRKFAIGDKLALASAAGTATLAGAIITVRFVWL